jgi:hypothetical protein
LCPDVRRAHHTLIVTLNMAKTLSCHPSLCNTPATGASDAAETLGIMTEAKIVTLAFTRSPEGLRDALAGARHPRRPPRDDAGKHFLAFSFCVSFYIVFSVLFYVPETCLQGGTLWRDKKPLLSGERFFLSHPLRLQGHPAFVGHFVGHLGHLGIFMGHVPPLSCPII